MTHLEKTQRTEEILVDRSSWLNIYGCGSQKHYLRRAPPRPRPPASSAPPPTGPRRLPGPRPARGPALPWRPPTEASRARPGRLRAGRPGRPGPVPGTTLPTQLSERCLATLTFQSWKARKGRPPGGRRSAGLGGELLQMEEEQPRRVGQ